jgi:hypothetical protein
MDTPAFIVKEFYVAEKDGGLIGPFYSVWGLTNEAIIRAGHCIADMGVLLSTREYMKNDQTVTEEGKGLKLKKISEMMVVIHERIRLVLQTGSDDLPPSLWKELNLALEMKFPAQVKYFMRTQEGKDLSSFATFLDAPSLKELLDIY